MDRAEALDKYVLAVNDAQKLAESRLEVVRQLNNIDAEMDNISRDIHDLRMIVLAKIVKPQRTNPYPLNNLAKRVNVKGLTQLAIIQVLKEASEPIASKEIAERAGMGYNAVSCALSGLVKWGIVNMEGIRLHNKYSLAVHPDPSRTEERQ